MSAKFSYATILHAVGQVLDQVGAKSIAIHEEEEGLFVEGLNSDGELQVQIHYTIADLYDLVKRSDSQPEEHVTASTTTGLLNRFLAEREREHSRELVGVLV
jgi:hypothetical protein